MLEVQDLRKEFDGLQALDGVSLTVPKGQIVGLIGPNGSGKSTLLNIIAGTIPPTSGQIRFDSHDITRSSADDIFKLGLARGYQNASLFFQMTVLDNTLLPVKQQRGEHPWYAPWRRVWNAEEQTNATSASQRLSQVNLRSHFNKRASDLSGGQMKLLEMARSLMGSPKMLLLDEPTAGVAPALALDIFRHIDTLCREAGITFLIVEHRLEMLFEFTDSVYVMHMGRVMAHGTPEEIEADAAVREVYFGE
jgi:branched-chain amino acid transport system ATP-binding protein